MQGRTDLSGQFNTESRYILDFVGVQKLRGDRGGEIGHLSYEFFVEIILGSRANHLQPSAHFYDLRADDQAHFCTRFHAFRYDGVQIPYRRGAQTFIRRAAQIVEHQTLLGALHVLFARDKTDVHPLDVSPRDRPYPRRHAWIDARIMFQTLPPRIEN